MLCFSKAEDDNRNTKVDKIRPIVIVQRPPRLDLTRLAGKSVSEKANGRGLMMMMMMEKCKTRAL